MILIFLFVVQKFGTDKVGASFAPIIFIWFTFIAAIGLYDLIKYDITVLRAFNPFYIITYFIRNGKQAWISLGGVIMCITGTEAMFADLGHFNVRAIQVTKTSLVRIIQFFFLFSFLCNFFLVLWVMNTSVT